MTKHSKNNTASSIFSYHEYKKAATVYGTKRQRLGNESLRRFDACVLCLQTAREPVCCKEGHLFCKECAMNDLLSQKKDLKRQKEKAEQIKKQIQEEVESAKETARERVLRDFERGQLGLAFSPSGSSTAAVADPTSTGKKRAFSDAFEFNDSRVSKIVAEAEEAAAREIVKERAEATKGVLPDFWLPSLTPTFGGVTVSETLAAGGTSEVKTGAMCRGGGERHSLSLKDLTPVKFTHHAETSKAGNDEESTICPSCMKTLSNNTIIYLMKPCAHVICRTCKETLMAPTPGEQACVACETRLKKKDIIELKREGTGFAGGGLAEAKRSGTSFQG
ncbi:unnamed protein product [Mycena citricolor]|uniref:RING-type domain-containing protein n=1 Tax=Mycena citricolor TaxID=2018698 RepID=A0AAD2H5X8_9AGAR|nr:unnamed protein product [Mycena citricolor]